MGRKAAWLCFGAGVALALFGVVWMMIPAASLDPASPRGEASYAFVLDTPEKAVGWADDVFVGTVTGELPEPVSAGPDLPYRTYRVEVRTTLRGRVSGAVRVARLPSGHSGSADGSGRLASGGTYVFATRLDPESGRHTLPCPDVLHLQPVRTAADPRVNRWVEALPHATAPAAAPPSMLSRAPAPERAYIRAQMR